MTWVRAKYADELSVLATWLAVALPWSVSYTDRAPLDSVIVFLRHGLFELQLRFPAEITVNGDPLDVAGQLAATYSGSPLVGNLYLDVPWAATSFYDGSLAVAYAAYALASLVLAGAFALSLAMYFREDRTRAVLPIAYPRLTGYALGAVVILHVVSAVFLVRSAVSVGFPVPVGLVVTAALAYALVRVDLNQVETSNDAVEKTAVEEPDVDPSDQVG